MYQCDKTGGCTGAVCGQKQFQIIYMGDTGLLVTQIMKNRDSTDEDLYKALIIDNLGINQGMIVENIVAQMLRAAGHELYFHEYLYVPEGTTREKKYEIDFMIVKKKKICPIEVKIFKLYVAQII